MVWTSVIKNPMIFLFKVSLTDTYVKNKTRGLHKSVWASFYFNLTGKSFNNAFDFFGSFSRNAPKSPLEATHSKNHKK